MRDSFKVKGLEADITYSRGQYRTYMCVWIQKMAVLRKRFSPLSSLRLAFLIAENKSQWCEWIFMLRVSSLNLKNYFSQTRKLNTSGASLRRQNPNPISIWQLLSLWVKSLISLACQGKIYSGTSRWLTLDGFLSWLDAPEEQTLPCWQSGPFVCAEPWEAILFQPHPISSQFEWRRLVLQSAASATRINVLHTLAHEN